jgi:anti-sigma factor RsiW
MSCSPFDLRDYVLKELSEPEKTQVDLHTKTCAACREDLERLQLTETALLALPDEEIPQRLAFVSDKVFEPSSWRRGWSAFWGSAARLGFASAALLSIALTVLAVTGTARNSVITATGLTQQQLQQQVQAAVDRAVGASEARMDKRISDIQRENREQQQQLLRAADSLVDYSRREKLMLERSSYQ